MNIRDLEQYIKLDAGEVPEQIGVEGDKVFERRTGEIVSVSSHIMGLSSVAKDPEKQVFYELLQNAKDAKASNFEVFFNENYFLAINNGLPFYTDDKTSKRKGQLKDFLSKNKSRKGDGDIARCIFIIIINQ